MSRGRHATPVKLAKKERQELLSLIGRKTAAQRDVMRARIALLAHEGHSNTMIAQELSVSVQTVSQWRKRIARQGVQGIREGERSGRPARITQETRLQLIALACEAQEAEGRVTPTLDEIVVRAVERGIVGQISRPCAAYFAGRRHSPAPGPTMAAQSGSGLSREGQCDLQTVSPRAQKRGSAEY